MQNLGFSRPQKCFFCEHDRGHIASTNPPQCDTCFNFKNFQVKKKMHPRQYHDWQKYKEYEGDK
jgi:hypothetical protein